MKKFVLVLAVLCVMTSAFCVIQVNVIGSVNKPVSSLYDSYQEDPSSLIEIAKADYEAGLQFRFMDSGFDLGIEGAVSVKEEGYTPVLRAFAGLNVPLFGFVNLGNAIGYEIRLTEGEYAQTPYYRFSGGIGLGIFDLEIYALMPVSFENGFVEALNIGNKLSSATVGVAAGFQF